jgi:hypothetical protein
MSYRTAKNLDLYATRIYEGYNYVAQEKQKHTGREWIEMAKPILTSEGRVRVDDDGVQAVVQGGFHPVRRFEVWP